jgi:hypothetical protein
MPKPFLVGCCECGSLLMKDGSKSESIFTADGLLNMDRLSRLASVAADFDTCAEADETAKKAGWRADNRNHRCPDCAAKKEWRDYVDGAAEIDHAGEDSGRQGMYIDSQSLERVL